MSSKLIQPARPIGIVGYRAYFPRFRLITRDVSLIWRDGRDLDSLPIEAVSLPEPDRHRLALSAHRQFLLEFCPAEINRDPE